MQHFDGSNAFVFFQIPSSVTIDTVNMLPQPMFCKLFPELGEFDNQLSPELLLQLEEKSLVLLTALERRFKNQ